MSQAVERSLSASVDSYKSCCGQDSPHIRLEIEDKTVPSVLLLTTGNRHRQLPKLVLLLTHRHLPVADALLPQDDRLDWPVRLAEVD